MSSTSIYTAGQTHSSSLDVNQRHLASPRLNWDILLLVVNELIGVEWEEWDQVVSVLSLMQTCHTLYKAGMPYLLRSPNYRVFGEAKDTALAFTTFVLQDPRRPLFISKLYLATCNKTCVTKLDSDLALAVGRVLNMTENIKIISIPSSEEWFSSSSQFPLAFLSLNKLTSVSLFEIGSNTVKTLGKLCSPVSYLELDFDLYEPKHLRLPSDFTHHLSEIKLLQCTHVLRDESAVYPKTTKLVLQPINQLNIAALMRSFPNVTSLTVGEGHIFGNRRLSQAQLGNFSGVRWTTLDYLHISVESYHTLSLSCRASVWECVDIGWHLRRFTTVLQAIRPSRLSLNFSSQEWSRSSVKDYLPVLEQEAITHLRFIVNMNEGESTSTTRQILDELAAVTHNLLSLAFLEIRILRAMNRRIPFQWKSPRKPDPGNDYLQKLDVNAYAMQFATTPKLENFCFRLMRSERVSIRHDEPRRLDSFWAVERGPTGQDPKMVKLTMKDREKYDDGFSKIDDSEYFALMLPL
ncbi:hypothetical protein BXZ70DRAFT_1075435 [Cristinia sonorae]|uniref:Uncharacterized protein n=1 Tax=Cristinia sonorae TaxID=1940300 RepID=A0A8K0UWJ1_9AGAR|nr:hypothetical protein BXZ70DRAFT_1075435 [Cristinia sonorae]